MASIKVGDIVTRVSYPRDVFFKVVDLCEDGEYATLKGLNIRVLADAPISDLVLPSPAEVRDYKKNYIKKSNEYMERIFYRRELERESRFTRSETQEGNGFFDVPGMVLHIDGDEEYLELCMSV